MTPELRQQVLDTFAQDRIMPAVTSVSHEAETFRTVFEHGDQTMKIADPITFSIIMKILLKHHLPTGYKGSVEMDGSIIHATIKQGRRTVHSMHVASGTARTWARNMDDDVDWFDLLLTRCASLINQEH